MNSSQAWIFQINAGKGMPKPPMHRAKILFEGIPEDSQRNRKYHGGTDRALCLFSLERVTALQAEGHPIYPGAMGENLTLVGLDWDKIVLGTQLRLGSDVMIEVTDYTSPCSHVRDFFLEGRIGRSSQKKYPGWSRVYAKVLHQGEIQVGDKVELIANQ